MNAFKSIKKELRSKTDAQALEPWSVGQLRGFNMSAFDEAEKLLEEWESKNPAIHRAFRLIGRMNTILIKWRLRAYQFTKKEKVVFT